MKDWVDSPRYLPHRRLWHEHGHGSAEDLRRHYADEREEGSAGTGFEGVVITATDEYPPGMHPAIITAAKSSTPVTAAIDTSAARPAKRTEVLLLMTTENQLIFLVVATAGPGWERTLMAPRQPWAGGFW